jgi:dTDP-glucose 4,6-dehydratase
MDSALKSERAPILVTGGAGFIGSALIRRLVKAGESVVNVDALTYAGNLDSLKSVSSSPLYVFEHHDISDAHALQAVFARHEPRAVIHLAAESHVDRSIDAPDAFIQTNVVGTMRLLQAARRHYLALPSDQKARFRFVHVSTDEVFGSLGDTGAFNPATPYAPTSPYSASKAASDHLARAWHLTFGLPVLVTNCSNNYGPYQFPEKLIPLIIFRALRGASLPVYGDGSNVRDWIFVEDHVDGIVAALDRGESGATYLFGGQAERRNIDVVRSICRILDDISPDPAGGRERLIEFVRDRPGHDYRYAIDTSETARLLGWAPGNSFERGLRATIEWYMANREWVERVQSGSYRGDRLGDASSVTVA